MYNWLPHLPKNGLDNWKEAQKGWIQEETWWAEQETLNFLRVNLHTDAAVTESQSPHGNITKSKRPL